MQKSNSLEYLSKEMAAKKSGRSERRLLELASAGRIRKRYVNDPKTKRKVAVFHAEDIAKLAEIPRGDRELATLPQSARRSAMMLWRPSKDVEKTEPGTQIPPRPWLTVDEAADYTGLPQKFLLGLIACGTLLALDVGVRQGGRWRIAKKDLDEISGQKQTE